MTLLERSPDEVEHRFIEANPSEQLLEVLVHHFLSHIRLRAFALISGAVVIDVLLLFDLGDDRAATMAALHEARIGEVLRVHPYVCSLAAINYRLDGFPKFVRDDRFVPALIDLPVPIV
ncbi:hypothetical protein [Sphingobium sp. LB126]|uniref:hypothetical protein n=1 Tax=Sphingobium sp. LB126 TaxID=1983755 RepID=UPI001F5BB53B|nr:hypothetical protein [Sphingobium sp. LB126]